MLVQERVDAVPHGVENEVDTFPSRQLCGWNKIGVASDQDDLIDLSLVGKRGDVDADPHVDAFLPGLIGEIVIDEVRR